MCMYNMVLLTAKPFARLLTCKSILLNTVCFDELGCPSKIENNADGGMKNGIFDDEKSVDK